MDVYHVDGETGEIARVIDGIPHPNGLCFSPDESQLYLVETFRGLHVYDLTADGRGVENGRVFVEAGQGEPDGIRCDVLGNVWAGWGGGADLHGVRVFAPDGTAIAHVHLPERCANICFGGPHRTRLFMTASQSLYALHVVVQGAPYF
jgi:gluconolactonase